MVCRQAVGCGDDLDTVSSLDQDAETVISRSGSVEVDELRISAV